MTSSVSAVGCVIFHPHHSKPVSSFANEGIILFTHRLVVDSIALCLKFLTQSLVHSRCSVDMCPLSSYQAQWWWVENEDVLTLPNWV